MLKSNDTVMNRIGEWKNALDREKSNIILYCLSSGISMLGSTAYTFAMGLHVLELTGSGLGFSMVLAIGIVATIVANPFAGVMADRMDRKSLIIASDMVNGLSMLLLLLVMKLMGEGLLWIYMATAAVNIFSTVHGIALESLKPDLVTVKGLKGINSYGKIVEASASIIGPMTAGFAFSIMTIEGIILLNGLSFFASAGLQLVMRVFECHRDETAKMGIFGDMKDAVVHIAKNPWIVRYLMIFIIINFSLAFSMNVPLPYFVNRIVMLSTSDFGIIQAGFPIGMVIGALTVGRMMERLSVNRLLSFGIGGLSIGLLVMSSVMVVHSSISRLETLTGLVMVMVLSGVSVAWMDVPIFIEMQKKLESGFRGRVMGLGITAAKIVAPLALVVSGMLISIMDIQWLTLAGVIFMLPSLFLILDKKQV